MFRWSLPTLITANLGSTPSSTESNSTPNFSMISHCPDLSCSRNRGEANSSTGSRCLGLTHCLGKQQRGDAEEEQKEQFTKAFLQGNEKSK